MALLCRYLSVRHYSLLISVLLGLLCTIAQAVPVPNLTNPNLHKVSSKVYALIGEMAVPNEQNDGFIANSAFIITDKSVIVIDPGGSVQIGKMVIEQIRSITPNPITHVINTHHHADHWMGNHAFVALNPKPQIIGHPYMRDTAKEIGERWLKILSDLTKGKTDGTKLFFPDTVLNGDETLVIDGLTLQFIHPAHAHTKGDLVIYLPEEKILLPGDVLFHLRTPGFQDASPLGNLATLQQLIKLDFNKVVPGHGPVTDKTGVLNMIEYVSLLHNEVKKYYDLGLSDFEMKDRIDVKQFASMSGFNERFGINVNRMYLEVEAASFNNE